MRALVLDDAAVIRRCLRRALEPEGIEVVEAADAMEALAVFQSGPPIDLAFLDWRLPGMDGFELLNIIRSDSKFNHTRILMVSTETDEQYVHDALKAGADEYIMKPFSQDLIMEKVHKFLPQGHRDQA